MHRAQVHGGDILLIWVEDHVPGYAVVFFNAGQRIVNPRAVQSRLADGIQQRVHRIIGQRGKLLRLLVKAILEAAIEVEPLWIIARGIVGKNSLEALGGVAGLFQQSVAQGSIRAKDSLFHPGSTHLLQDHSRLRLVGPQHNRVSAR